jgi:small subunit ribosomal protein S20
MPRTKTAKKELRKNLRRRRRNAARRSTLKKIIKTYERTLTGNDQKEIQAALKKVHQALDKAAKVNLIKKNKASRLKSRLTKRSQKKSE